MSTNNLGVLPDNRTPLQKENAITSSEILGSTSITPTLLPNVLEASKYVKMFPIDNQQGTSSCVAHGKVLALSIFMYLSGITKGVFVQLSSMFIYRNRINYPGEGMVPSSADVQVEQEGAPPYADMPTPETEELANALTVNPAITKAAQQFAGIRWVELVDPTDINTIAFIANNQSLPLNILIYATVEEWSQSTVQVITPGLVQGSPEAVVSHCITVLPNSAYTSNGETYVIIQDSALFGGIAFRSVAGSFIKQRCYECAYPISVDNAPVLVKPQYTLTTPLSVGDSGDSVTQLQEMMQYMGYMPNVVNGAVFAPTGYYGGLTKQAVMQLQNEYASEILTPEGITEATGYCGTGTIAFLNSLFGNPQGSQQTS